MSDTGLRRRNLSIAPTPENAVPAGEVLFWDRDRGRLVAGDYADPPPPDSTSPTRFQFLRRLWKGCLWRMRG